MTRSAKAVVRKKYPNAYGWRQFSISDYVVMAGTNDGKELASALYAKDAWAIAAKKIRECARHLRSRSAKRRRRR